MVNAAATITTTTTVAAAANPVAVGTADVLTATVVAASGTGPTGSVTFKKGTTTLGTGTLSGAGLTRTATYSAIFTSVAANSITAVYAGDTTNKTSTSSALSVTSQKANSTTAVGSSLNPSTSGASVTFTATVVGYAPTGTVTFKDGTTTLGTGTLSGTGNTRTATYANAALSIATHSITAVYAGNTLNNTSTSSALSQVVNKKVTTTALTSSVNPTAYGGSTTLTATVTPATATGTITFNDGATTIGTGVMVSGKATLAIATLTGGAHGLTAVYGGDASNATSTSSVLTQTVNKKTTTTALNSSVNPTSYGSGTTLTATISGGTSPSGTVTFIDGATAIGTGTVSGTTATLAIATLAAGSHSLTAVYGGDTNNATSTSSTLSQGVLAAPVASSIALTSNSNPSTLGAAITFTATVTGNNPTGLVSFLDGTTTLGTASISGGVATFINSSLGMGSHSIIAAYGGDANNNSSTSVVLSQSVNAASTSVSLGSSVNPAAYGGSTTLTATVIGWNPTGTVTFMDGATTLGAGTISAGVATYTTAALTVGVHSIIAVYGGDANNATSTSPVVSQTVNTVATTTSLTSSTNPSTFGGTVTFTASVAGGNPTGTVTFKDGATTLGTGAISGGVATFATTALTSGTHGITGVYSGDTNTATSTSSVVSQLVYASDAAATNTTLSSDTNPSVYAGSVKLTAIVSGSTATGSMTFIDMTSGQAIGVSGVSGTTVKAATLVTSSLPVGSHTIYASYSGDVSNFASNSPAIKQVVNDNRAATSTILTRTPNPSTTGTPVTLTATVSGTVATGSVTFMDGAASIGTGLLTGTTSKQATLVTSALSIGTHSLSAVYSGDANSLGSASAALTQSVSATSATTTTLMSSGLNAVANVPITFIATVNAANATGTVTFVDTTTSVTLGIAHLQAGVANSNNIVVNSARLTVSNLAVGTHSIAAIYAGDNVYLTSTSSNITQSVTTATLPVPSVTLTFSTPNPVFGPSTLLTTIRITPPSGYTAIPAGGYNLKDGNTLWTGGTFTTAANGVINITGTPVSGTHTYVATWNGDANYAPSQSLPVSLSVSPKPTTTTLTSNTANAIYGTPLVLTSSTAGYNPSATVSFYDGSALIGTSGAFSPSVTTSSLNVGVHSITSFFPGDVAGNGPSTSAPISVTIAKATTAVPGIADNLGSGVTTTTAGAPITFVAGPITTAAGVTVTTGTAAFFDEGVQIGVVPLDMSGQAIFAASLGAVGLHNITASYVSNSNVTGVMSAIHPITITPTTTTTALNLQSVKAGSPAALVATIKAGVTPLASATGLVSFSNGATPLGSVSPVKGVATLNTSALGGAGIYAITASYAGDSNSGASSATGDLSISKAYPTTVLSTSQANTAFGVPVSFTANVSGYLPSGNVRFYDNGVLAGTAAVALVGGQYLATYTTSTLSVGRHNIYAAYNGDVNNANTSASAVLAQLVGTPATVTVSSSTQFAQSGAPVVLTSNVSGSILPTGSVQFLDGATVLGTSTLSNGVAVFNAVFNTAGAHNVTASYLGDSNNVSNTSGSIVVTTAVATTSISLSSSLSSVSFGQSVTLSATVVGAQPSGTVLFYDGSTPIGSAQIASGVAALVTSNLWEGARSITARYAGDANNSASALSNSVVVSVALAAAPTWHFGYDANGNINTVVDPNGQTTYSYYDQLGRKIQTLQPPAVSGDPTITQFGYNKNGSLSSVSDPRNLVTNYTSDGYGRTMNLSSPDSGNSGYAYDLEGRQLNRVDGAGKTSTMTYDDAGRLIGVAYQSGVGTTIEYDGGTSKYGGALGKVTKLTDESGQTAYAYDALGRMSGKTQVTNGKSFTISYAWGDTGSALDKLIGITYPSGNRVNYSYDAQGYVSGISVNPVNANGVGVSSASLNLLSAIGYNADNNITGWNWSDAKARTIAYDSFGQISGYSLGDPAGVGASAGELRTLVRDAAGRITGYTHTNNAVALPGLDQTFGYDNLNRLLSATLASTTTQYSYDANGNRTAKTIGGTSYANTISATSNRLVQVQDVGGTAIVQHDSAGNIINDGTNSFTYSDRGRMSSATNAGGTVNYLYNARELRVAKSGPVTLVPTGAAYYVYNEAGQLLGEYDGNGSPVYETVYLGQTPVGVMKQTGTPAGNNIAVTLYNVHADHLATARIITRQADQAIVWRWDAAEAFGGSAANQDPNTLGTFVYNPRFPGQVFDAETGLNQNWHREYNARMGRYLQSDPIGLAGGINTFAYVDGNPLGFADPMGLIRYNAPAPRTVPVEGSTLSTLICLETCLMGSTGNLKLDLLITGGAEIAGHSKGSHHSKGEACDIHSSNPITEDDMGRCAPACGFGGGQYERFTSNPNRDHWHLQLTPGNGVPPIGTKNESIPIKIFK